MSIIKRILRRVKKTPPTAGFAEIERAERIFYLEYLRDNMIVFDVGANVGELTLMFSRFAGGGQVHSFEASRAAFQKLEAVCGLMNRRNVFLNHLALAEKKGTIHLHVYDENYLAFNTQAVREIEEAGAAIKPVEIEETPAATIDDYCAEMKIEHIDLLKIDVEGAELQVLKGADRMLSAKRVKCLTFEFGQATFDMGGSAAEIESFLHKNGYRIRNLIKHEKTFPNRSDRENGGFSMHVAAPAASEIL